MERRESRSLIPFQDIRGLAERGEEGLTQKQFSQLQRVLKSYLRENGVQGSYINLTQVVPVVRGCIEDGLDEAFGRRNIEPQDSLDLAYQKGNKKRKAILAGARDIISSMQQVGGVEATEWALERWLVGKASDELKQQALQLDISTCRTLLGRVQARKPIFESLLTLAKAEAERFLPGSKDIILTRQQEAGLVRNFIFSYIAEGQVNPLVEIEDINSNAVLFRTKLQHNLTVWEKFCQTFGLNFNQAKDYLGDLGKQMTDVLDASGAGRINSLEAIDVAFKALSPVFAIVNPFYKLTGFSEDPKNKEGSIWDAQKCHTVVIDNKPYRIPEPKALVYASYQLQTEDRTRSIQLLRASRLVRDFLEQVEKGNEEAPEVVSLDEKITELKRQSDQLTELATEGQFADFAYLNQEKLTKYAEMQRAVLQEECSTFPLLRAFISEERKWIVDLLSDHTDGQPLEEGELPDFFRAERVPLFAMHTAKALRNRMSARVRALETMIGYRNPLSRFEDPEGFYAQALQTSVLTVLNERSNKWIERSAEVIEVINDALRYMTTHDNRVHQAQYMLAMTPERRFQFLIERFTDVEAEGDKERILQRKIRNLTNEPYYATQRIALALARITSESFWPKPQVTFRNFLHGKPEVSAEDSVWIFRPGLRFKERLAKIRRLRGIFRDFLSDLGLRWDNEIFTKYIAPGHTISQMAVNGVIFSNFFGCEAAFTKWCKDLEDSVNAQLALNPKILAMNVPDLASKYEGQIRLVEGTRKFKIRELNQRRLNNLRELQALGVALPEASFIS